MFKSAEAAQSVSINIFLNMATALQKRDKGTYYPTSRCGTRTHFMIGEDTIFQNPVKVYNANPFSDWTSFCNWPFDRSTVLLEAGFRYSGEDDVLICIECQLRTNYQQWNKSKEPYEIHVELSPECERAKHVNNIKTISKCLSEEKEKEIGPLYPNFTDEERRRRTFTCQIFLNKRIDLLAKAGFFYRDEGVTCFFCGFSLEAFEYDNPCDSHTILYTNCYYIRELDDGIHLKKAQQWREKNHFLYLNKTHVVERIKSFRELQASFGNHSTKSLADAGFFAERSSNTVIAICFCCGLKVLPWSSDETPWEIHAKAAARCFYLELRKGEEFIERTRKGYEEKCSVTGSYTAHEKTREHKELSSLSCTMEEINTGMCVRCKQREITTIFNCGHRLTCQLCSKRFINASCPYCDVPVIKTAETPF